MLPDLTSNALIDGCIAALGGRDSLYNVRSIHLQITRSLIPPSLPAQPSELHIYRAQGGRIRLEYTTANQKEIFILNGLAGVTNRISEQGVVSSEPLTAMAIETIKRSVRLYPRNFLAHADEHNYEVVGLKVVEDKKVYLVELQSEQVSYYFDAETLLCQSLTDNRQHVVIKYSDYQNIQGIVTALTEEHYEANNINYLDKIVAIDYNLALPETFFMVDSPNL